MCSISVVVPYILCVCVCICYCTTVYDSSGVPSRNNIGLIQYPAVSALYNDCDSTKPLKQDSLYLQKQPSLCRIIYWYMISPLDSLFFSFHLSVLMSKNARLNNISKHTILFMDVYFWRSCMFCINLEICYTRIICKHEFRWRIDSASALDFVLNTTCLSIHITTMWFMYGWSDDYSDVYNVLYWSVYHGVHIEPQ